MTIDEGWGPRKILKNGKRITGIELARCTSLCDEKGRFNPCLDEQDTRTLEADMIILAIGQAPDLSFLSQEVTVTEGGTMQTGLQSQGRQLFWSLRRRRYSLRSLDRVAGYSRREKSGCFHWPDHRREDLKKGRDERLTEVKKSPREGIPEMTRLQTPLLSTDERAKTFREVAIGFDEDMAYLESQRCMTCGSRAVINFVAKVPTVPGLRTELFSKGRFHLAGQSSRSVCQDSRFVGKDRSLDRD